MDEYLGFKWVGDPVARIARLIDDDGKVVDQRPYTDEENAAADEYEAYEARLANRARIESNAVTALTELGQILTDMDTLAATPEETIAGNPALYIKQMGAGVRTVALIERRIIRYVFNHLDAAN